MEYLFGVAEDRNVILDVLCITIAHHFRRKSLMGETLSALALCAKDVETACPRLRVMLAAPAVDCCARFEQYLAHSPKVEVVARADQESRALKLYFEAAPDCIVLDWRTAEGQPARLIALLRRAAPDACIVSIVPSVDSMPARAARALGADYVVTCEMLPGVIDALLARRAYAC